MTSNSIRGNISEDRGATIDFSLEELMIICNALNNYAKRPDATKMVKKVHRDMYVISSLAKNGHLDEVAIDYINTLRIEEKECEKS